MQSMMQNITSHIILHTAEINTQGMEKEITNV